MSRKDYELIAETLRGLWESPLSEADHRATCAAFATALADESDRFDRAKFLAACGVES